MPAKQAAALDVIELPPLDMRTYAVRIVGDSPLIIHNWSEKAKQEMRDKQQGKARAKKEPKDPVAEFNGARYALPGGMDGIRSVAFKKAAVAACRQVQGMTMVFARSAFLVLGEFCEIACPGERCPPNRAPREGEYPVLREDMVRVGMGVADLRYRPEYRDWSTTAHVRFNAAAISLEQVTYLLTLAGQSIGVCENRPEKSGDSFGLFHVEDVERVG